MIKSFNQRITFGKHKGQYLHRIAQFDPDYLEWLCAAGLADKSMIDKMHRNEFKKIKLSDGYAIVF